MKTETSAGLIRDFPELYPSDFHFEVGDGWGYLMRELSWKIATELRLMEEEDRAVFKVLQVKNKFGELRYSVSGASDHIDELIEMARLSSRSTCELCAKIGEIGRLGVMLACLCDACRDDINKKAGEREAA